MNNNNNKHKKMKDKICLLQPINEPVNNWKITQCAAAFGRIGSRRIYRIRERYSLICDTVTKISCRRSTILHPITNCETSVPRSRFVLHAFERKQAGRNILASLFCFLLGIPTCFPARANGGAKSVISRRSDGGTCANDTVARFAADTTTEWGYSNSIHAYLNSALDLMMTQQATLNGRPDNGTYGNPVAVCCNERIVYEITAVNANLRAGGYLTICDTLPPYLNYVDGTATVTTVISDSATTAATVGGEPDTSASDGTTQRKILQWCISKLQPFDTVVIRYEAMPEKNASAAQALFINRAWVCTSDTIFTATNPTYHQSTDVSASVYVDTDVDANVGVNADTDADGNVAVNAGAGAGVNVGVNAGAGVNAGVNADTGAGVNVGINNAGAGVNVGVNNEQ
jgi:hypothetical protein